MNGNKVVVNGIDVSKLIAERDELKHEKDVLLVNVETLSKEWAKAQLEIERLKSQLDTTHSYGENCQRLACVQRREIERMRTALNKIVEYYGDDDPESFVFNVAKSALERK